MMTELNRTWNICCFVVAMSALIAIAGCDRSATEQRATNNAATTVPTDKSLTIVATTGMIADIVREVAGDRANVTALMGAGVDPHLYRPTRDDMSKLLNADLIFYNGLNLEGKMTDSFVQVARAGKPVYAVTELLDETYLFEPPGFEGHADPHVWMDPLAWAEAVRIVKTTLAEHDPTHAEAHHARGEAYLKELQDLDTWAKDRLATIPANQRVLVTAHDAFNYFARAYQLEVRGIQGISTESEAGLKEIEELVTLLVERKVPAVFTETSVSDRNINALIDGAKSRGQTVVIGGRLFSDAMGPAGTYEGTYIGMLDHNVTTITRALGGEADPKGMQKKLSSTGAE